MPGPLWKHAVKDLDAKLDKCGVQAENVRTMNEELPTFRKEIFNNGNTLVEVAIKTHRPKSHVPIKTRRIVTTHHKPVKTSKAVSHGTNGPAHRNQWRDLLADSNIESRETSKASSVEPEKNSKHHVVKSKTSKTKKRSQESNPKHDDEVDAVHGRFQNRTLRVFLNEMRAALNSDRDPEKACKILDDLEYVALNLRQDKLDASSERSKTNNTANSSRAKQSLKSQDNERNLELRAKNEQIQELKAMITRLTANNNDMLALLTQKVGLEDSLKVAKSANQELLKKLTEETKKTINLTTKLSSAEQEIKRLRIVVKDMKSSLHSDLQEALRPIASRSSKPTGSNNETVDLMLSELENSGKESKDDDDQADSAIHSESHPLSNQELEPSQKIIQEAKEMIENKPPTSSRDFMPVVLDLSETRADLASDTTLEDVPHKDKTPNKRNAIDPKGLQNRADANVKAFLDRMRNQDSLNLTLPKLPNAKTFDETTTTLHLTGVSDLDTTKSLSESKFRKGLEQTDLVISDHE